MQRRDLFRLLGLAGASTVLPLELVGCGASIDASVPSFATRSSLRALAPDGSVEALVSADGSVAVRSQGSSRTLTLAPNACPLGLAVAPDGRVAVADASRGEVRLFATGDADAYAIVDRDALCAPRGLAFTSDGTLVVADTTGHRVVVVDLDGNVRATFGSLGTGAGQLNGPRDVAIDSAGRIHVVEIGNARVSTFTRDGRVVSTLGAYGRDEACFLSPRSVALDVTGRLYVADPVRGDVQVFLAGAPLTRFAPPSGVPISLVTLPDGRVEVVVADV